MQKLKHTFKRSKTPTGAEMKVQNSLEVPKQIRSASFDEMKLGTRRHAIYQQGSLDTTVSSNLLQVPNVTGNPSQRSKSFDTNTTSQLQHEIEIPTKKSFPGWKSPTEKQDSYCIHCYYIRRRDALASQESSAEDIRKSRSTTSESSSYDRLDSENDADEENSTDVSDVNSDKSLGCKITVTTSATEATKMTDISNNNNSQSYDLETSFKTSLKPPSTLDILRDDEIPQTTSRRRSITSPKLERQKAFVLPETADDSSSMEHIQVMEKDPVVNEFFLKVPDLKRDRAVSVDSCFIKKNCHSIKQEEVTTTSSSNFLEPPSSVSTARSRSVDIVLPTKDDARYKAISAQTAAEQLARKYSQSPPAPANTPEQYEISSGRRIYVPDWTENAKSSEHLWHASWKMKEPCYLQEDKELKCTKQGDKVRCGACKLIAHTGCIPLLESDKIYDCRQTFRVCHTRTFRDTTPIVNHHFSHRRSLQGKCETCKNPFHVGLFQKHFNALCCTWCKLAYHSSYECFPQELVNEPCGMGAFRSLTVPHLWIIKFDDDETCSVKKIVPKLKHEVKIGDSEPDEHISVNTSDYTLKITDESDGTKSWRDSKPSTSAGALKSSHESGVCDKSNEGLSIPLECVISNKDDDDDDEKIENNKKNESLYCPFQIRPVPTDNITPLLVFINPKSGGNDGWKLIRRLQYHLNPRQVFDLSQFSPRFGLEIFKNVSNVQILGCGGDGTIGWILSELDRVWAPRPYPPIAVCPLGTGNDLARALRWGSGYSDEPVTGILREVMTARTVYLDRWSINVSENTAATSVRATAGTSKTLPLDKINNYFSMGVDAHVALSFHRAREANPKLFNSRIRNKMAYTAVGGVQLCFPQFRTLSESVQLICDGTDYTDFIRRHHFHSILFLNITSFAGGTHPWNTSKGKQSMDDGKIEVIGTTTFQLSLMQTGLTGAPICQCSRAEITTTQTLPMQVDGEACDLLPSIITIEIFNQGTMLTRRTRDFPESVAVSSETLRENCQKQLSVFVLKLHNYELYNHSVRTHQHNIEQLKATAEHLGSITVMGEDNLSHIRGLINKLALDVANEKNKQILHSNWVYLDVISAKRYFRIDVTREDSYFTTDICHDDEGLYVLCDSSEEIIIDKLETKS